MRLGDRILCANGIVISSVKALQSAISITSDAVDLTSREEYVDIHLLICRYADVFRVPSYLDLFRIDKESFANFQAQLRIDLNAELNSLKEIKTGVPTLPFRHPFIEQTKDREGRPNSSLGLGFGRLVGEILDIIGRTNNSFCVSENWAKNDYKNWLIKIHSIFSDANVENRLQTLKDCILALADEMNSCSYGRALRAQWNEPKQLRKYQKWRQMLHRASTASALAYHLSIFKTYIDFRAIKFATYAVDRAQFADMLTAHNALKDTHPQLLSTLSPGTLVYYFGDGHAEAVQSFDPSGLSLTVAEDVNAVPSYAPMWGATTAPVPGAVTLCRVTAAKVFLNGPMDGKCRPFAQISLEVVKLDEDQVFLLLRNMIFFLVHERKIFRKQFQLPKSSACPGRRDCKSPPVAGF